MKEYRDIRSQPAVIHLLTSRGHISSPPLEWTSGVDVLEYKFKIKKDLYVNGHIIAHPDGSVFYRSPPELFRVEAGDYTVRVNIDPGPCGDPECTLCKPT